MKIKEKFLQLSKFELYAWGFVIALLLMLVVVRQGRAQTEYLFTTKPTITKPMSFGSYTLNNPFEITVDFKSTYQTDQYRQTQLWQLGNTNFRFDYAKDDPTFNITIKGKDWTIYSYYAYATLTNRKWHTVIVRYDGVKTQFILDNVLIEEKMISTSAAPVTGTLTFSTAPLYVRMPTTTDTIPMDCLAGVIRNVRCGNGWSNIVFKQMPVFGLDSMDYAVGYNMESNTYTGAPIANVQLPLFPQATNKGYKDLPKISSAINWIYLAGKGQPGITDAEISRNLTGLAKVLCDSFNYALRIDNVNEFYSNPSYYTPILDLLKSNPQYVCDATSLLAQLNPIDGHVPLTKPQLDALLPNCPNSTFDNEKYIYDKLFWKLSLSVPSIRFVLENDEWLNFWTDTVKYQSNPECRAAKEATGLTWNQYRSKRFAEVFTYIVNDNVKKYYPKAITNRYDVFYSTGYWLNPLIDYAIKCNSDGNTSSQCYPQTVDAYKNGYGSKRGLFYYYDMVQYILRNRIGTGWNNPFIGGGWNENATKNLSPAQLSGFTVMLASAGVDVFCPAYFTLTGSGATGFQNPQSYLFQAVEASYVQAGLSSPDIWDLYQNSILQFGDQTDQWYRQDGYAFKPNFYFWTGWKNSVATVRRGNTRTHEYLIFTTVLKPTNTTDPVSFNRKDTAQIGSVGVPLNSNIAGRIFKYDDRLPIQANQDLPNPNPVVVYHGKKYHPSRLKFENSVMGDE